MTGLAVRARIAVRNIDYDIEAPSGSVLAVIGPNGAGKTSLLSIAAGLLRPDDGRVELDGRVLTDTSAGIHVPTHRRGIATLSQQPLLFPHLTAEANVAFAPRSAGVGRSRSKEVAREWLSHVGAAELAGRRPSELSGGQAQRVAVARALAADPALLLLDEPLAALDVESAPAVRRLLRTMLQERRRTAVLVTHDVLDALALADTVVVIDDGRVVERGPVRSVLAAPRSTFAARIAGLDLVDGTVVAPGTLRTPDGITVMGTGDVEVGSAAVAVFTPSAVAVHAEPPHGSPRNVFRATVSDIEVRGASVRVTARVSSTLALSADVTAAAVADLDLVPGHIVHLAVKAHEVALHGAP
ncbi:molybdenum ABC transporter ATP-binding protein [Rhodococcoides trifolii]|uniref:Molybdenum ABC transporter ATP-binding protein n=1 Tax=Rhodococcoides trifolii TaxID=908250 RepID=A0A917FU62_9NOCA|nr:ABC transporter ATP-binding protein [Rhodococcus trifolii]GGG01550.1 molybdenum ABC transporter ATP-binding protein [Rhodococcus trifolii]